MLKNFAFLVFTLTSIHCNAQNNVFGLQQNYTDGAFGLISVRVDYESGEVTKLDSILFDHDPTVGPTIVDRVDSIYYHFYAKQIVSYDLRDGAFLDTYEIFESTETETILNAAWDPFEGCIYGYYNTNCCDEDYGFYKYDPSEQTFETLYYYFIEDIGLMLNVDAMYDYSTGTYVTITPIFRNGSSINVTTGEILDADLYCDDFFGDELVTPVFQESTGDLICRSFDYSVFHEINPYNFMDCTEILEPEEYIESGLTKFTYNQEEDIYILYSAPTIKTVNMITGEVLEYSIPNDGIFYFQDLAWLGPVHQGCTDSEACNFNPIAVADDGSCEYESCFCPLGDANSDLIVNVLDLIAVSENWGCIGECEGDSDCNNIVNIMDLVNIGSFWGTAY